MNRDLARLTYPHYQMTGSPYAGMADHFFNNCIAANLLRLPTESGTDELMIVRALIAQLLSFFAVLAARKLHARKKASPGQMRFPIFRIHFPG